MWRLQQADVLRVHSVRGPRPDYQDWADWLNKWKGLEGAEAITPNAIAMMVLRHKDEWQAKYNIWVGLPKVDSSPEFSAWPSLPRSTLQTNPARSLGYFAKLRVLGRSGIPTSRKRQFFGQLRRMRKNGLVWRLDPTTWRLYEDPRGPHEVREDPRHLRLYESRAAFCERHPDHCHTGKNLIRSG